VHCIVWAKELYKLFFGTKIEDSMLFEDEESLRADTEAAEKEKDGNKSEDGDDEGKKGNDSTDDGSDNNAAGGEKSTYMDIVNTLRSLLGIGSVSDKPQSEGESALRSKAQEALTALFVTEIQKQIGMDRYKTADKVPVPISLDDIANCTTIQTSFHTL